MKVTDSTEKNSAEYFCPILQDTTNDPVKTYCGHIFDKTLLLQALKGSRSCPLCRRAITNPKNQIRSIEKVAKATTEASETRDAPAVITSPVTAVLPARITSSVPDPAPN